MPKTITSPVNRWHGTVEIAEPITEAQAIEIERTQAIIKDAQSKADSENFNDLREALGKSAKLRVIEACVEKWNLENFTSNPFPFSPKVAAQKLIEWLYDEILLVYIGESEIPNES